MTQNCPNCGGDVPGMMATARVMACPYCATTLVKADAVLTKAGTAGQMFAAPSLFTLDQPTRVAERMFTPRGHVRYDYGRGTWDEYWGEDGAGAPVWVSVDEGDVAWQVELDPVDAPQGRAFRLGAEVTYRGMRFVTTEVESATCTGFRGQLPEAPHIGEAHMFANFTGPKGAILSAERWDGGAAWFAGHWIDPFDVMTPP
jgi:hypothetical protein